MIRCLLCRKLSLPHICTTCQKNFLKPALSTRVIGDDFKVFSFYSYHDIAPLLKTKHTHIGASVYKILANNAMREFSKNFHFDTPVFAIGIDDTSKDGYAHTAILTKALKSEMITPVYGKLRAHNDVSYSGKDLAYRLEHVRGFIYHDKGEKDVILVDDIITTGTTLLEARNVLKKAEVTPIFALTLADARQM
jgi:competence protein ComFC